MVKFKPDEAGTLEYSDVHGDIFGTGIPLSVYMKALLKQIAFNLEEMFDGRKRLEWNDDARYGEEMAKLATSSAPCMPKL